MLTLASALMLPTFPVWANVDDDIDQDDGTLGAEGLHIPEPMAFDLVRPLGATQGELEVNALAIHGLGSNQVEWAPEIEYAVMDGLAFELELPMQNAVIEEYKVAAQGTLGRHGQFIHGWQIIGRHLKHNVLPSQDQVHNADIEPEGATLVTGAQYSADVLYIAGYRFNARWSTLNMLGLRGNHLGKYLTGYGLANLNLFYTLDDNRALGIEINNEFDDRQWNVAVTPQLHWNYSDRISMQFGPGMVKSQGSTAQWNVSCRLIYTF
ncbi:MAG: hypothetical protein CTY22_00210 [Methylomonas sp.]|nr:MAG: hypothetical protein CTY23_01330 [Methylomonas sp.]PPD27866.1 MAG: hypothetical protein CTY22_00210 [Methylomonas sp.]PPD39976.1 MAG: hypothetical protein CTY21_00210 [Methylomonas sp.]PPD41044.1 MAG: hypothetical protein CTY17_04655 [Methylomonas sp.]PPD52030.1 MAG: hypothetical protein CTY11_10480 [Methylomonas sp.]